MNELSHTTLNTPLGPLQLSASGAGLTGVYMQAHKQCPGTLHGENNPEHPVLVRAAQQLRAYFAGEANDFDLPLDAQGTAFQTRVWNALQTIPYGETRSYAQLAEMVGAPKAARAVGLANGRNPLSIVVPCHRVIGADGSLTGYGGGLENKRFLLKLEKALPEDREEPARQRVLAL